MLLLSTGKLIDDSDVQWIESAELKKQAYFMFTYSDQYRSERKFHDKIDFDSYKCLLNHHPRK